MFQKDSNMQKSKTQIKKKEMKLFIMSSITGKFSSVSAKNQK